MSNISLHLSPEERKRDRVPLYLTKEPWLGSFVNLAAVVCQRVILG